ncbi:MULTISPECIES: GntR family transcriptional regulator [Bacillus]|uniref:GntR family transcriptional regulator n=2 Tax=Bacillus TaxID=1386 RepID=A0A0M5JEB5_9BACI|nr:MULTISPECIES: GntR family transcriptional regulator [Bacillus]ALC82244.1 GntR family transcriptional regulator [Bacillus gobiensis]MBP1081096.1 GntR family transcriptional regulator [Bacillus capparidis]MED1095784.1 GntR family transcriptional regulator [Bacillus capparidis]
MFQLDLKSRKPIYEQLVVNIKELIISGVLKTDERLPSVRSLSGELTVNPNTIQRAYRELEYQGMIYSIKGKGNFVAPISGQQNVEKLVELKNEIRKVTAEAIFHGLTHSDYDLLYFEAKKVLKGEGSE